MFKKGTIALIGGLALIVSGGCLAMGEKREQYIKILETSRSYCDQEYDYDARLIGIKDENQLEDIVNSVYEIRCYAEKTLLGVGSCLLFDNGYVTTARHMTELKMNYPRGFKNTYYIAREDAKYELELIKLSDKADAALFKVKDFENMDIKGYSGKIGDSDKLKVGNIVYIFGNSAGEGILYKQAYVSSLKGLRGAQTPENKFKIVGEINPGDSGGPIFAVKDGTLELIGMTLEKLLLPIEGIGGYLRLNVVKDEFQEHLGKYY